MGAKKGGLPPKRVHRTQGALLPPVRKIFIASIKICKGTVSSPKYLFSCPNFSYKVKDILNRTEKHYKSQMKVSNKYFRFLVLFRQIYANYQNLGPYSIDGRDKEIVANLHKFFDGQDEFMSTMSANNQDDPFWRNVGLILSQYSGMMDGYKHVAPKSMVSHGHQAIKC